MGRDMEQEYTRAYLADDGSGHTYLIPHNLSNHFEERLSICDRSEDFIGLADSDEEYEYRLKIYNEEMYTYQGFEEEFGDYRVEGDYEIYAKF